MTGNGLTQTGPATVRFEVGTIDVLSAPVLDRIVTLRNTGRDTLTVERLQASCGCTSLLLGSDGGASTTTLAPGQGTSLRILIDLTHLRPGPLDKFVWVYVGGQKDPALTIEVAGQILPLVRFEPAVARFGQAYAGKAPSVTLKATLDARLITHGEWPRLVCSDPDVQVQVGEVVGAVEVAAGPAVCSRRYTLTLAPHAHLGLLSGELLYIPPIRDNAGPASTAERPDEALAALLSSVMVPLSGEVLGSIQAAPGTVVFGAVTAGQRATRTVTILSRSAAVLKGLRASSATPLITTRLLSGAADRRTGSELSRPANPAGSIPANPTVLLEVTVGAEAPRGTLQTQVTVITAEGERLILPVLVDVVPAPA